MLAAALPGRGAAVRARLTVVSAGPGARSARTGLITTEGVRDALEMRRGIRERQYENRYQNVVPLVPRRLPRPVHGRLDFRGKELEPLNLDEVRAAAEVFRDRGIAAVAVCLMHAYANPAHEEPTADLVRSVLPDGGAISGVSACAGAVEKGHVRGTSVRRPGLFPDPVDRGLAPGPAGPPSYEGMPRSAKWARSAKRVAP